MLRFVTLAVALVLGACATAAQRRAAEIAEIEKKAVQEIRRICALPESAREAQIEKLEDESSVTVNCGKK